MIDFHGSTGYGQAFTDAISGDWGGKPFDDLKLGLDAALETVPLARRQTACARSARSYGGYMINWIAGKADRFKAWSATTATSTSAPCTTPPRSCGSRSGSTAAPWDQNPAGYAQAQPDRLVTNWKTPTLVIHGGMDFRVADRRAIATFTALQRKGIPSRCCTSRTRTTGC